MGKHNIEKNTWLYQFTYRFVYSLHNLFYREFYVINRPEKRRERPSIITPNHQNALMDALAVLFAKKEPLVFLARSDIFKQKFVAAILYFLKILPIYRIRDGFDSLKNNQETFDHTVRILSSKRGLVILPEGSHYGAKTLRPLKKGFARIAFMTEINGAEKVDLQIVPTAIDYTAYDTFFTRLTVFFGEPFPLKPYMEEYKSAPQKALNNITKQLSDSLKKHIIHIESEAHYHACLLASAIYAEQKYSGNTPEIQEKRFVTQRLVTQRLNEAKQNDAETFQQITGTAESLRKNIGNLPCEIVGKKPVWFALPGLLVTIMLLPIALPGTIIYGIFWYWPVWFVNRKIQDVQFRTSFRYVLYIIQYFSLLTVILIYLLLAYPLKSALIIFFMTIVSGILSLKLWRLFYWMFLKTKWYMVSLKRPKVKSLRKQVIRDVSNLFNK